MFTGLIGEAFVSASIQVLLEKIASPKIVNYLLGKKGSDFDDLLKRLKTAVSCLGVVLDDAERRQIGNDPCAEVWLDDVQDAVFDAEDLLDEVETDAGACEARESKRRRTFSVFSSSGDIIERRVVNLMERLDDIVKQRDILGLRESTAEKRDIPWRRLPSTCLVDECGVYGRDDDKAKVMELLMSNSEKICAIPIVGMGGIGKTTLAQAVFNDRRVDEHFQIKAWACVSEEFNVCKVTSALIGSGSSSADLNSLQVELREKLAGKKFLIVLDDVWNESYLDWDTLRTPFKDGARGSKIIVSTRSSKVANVVGTVPSYQLAVLSDEACWKLFAKHTFGIGDFGKNPEMERIGREIVGKCRGLPLAVKTLGGLLRSTSDVGEWEAVSKSDLWELTDVRSRILPALRLSYRYLPPALKRCFAYCSIFPKDFEFDKEELILLWMAENLLADPNKNKRIEEVGDEYFNDLVSRSFLQKSKHVNNNKTTFVIHDLLVDLSKSVSKRYCFLSETSDSLEEASIKRARHFAFVPKQHYPRERFSPVFGAAHLRTFLPVKSTFSCMNLSKEVVDDLFLKLRCLRVLSLSGSKTTVELPNSIGELKQLRYLDLSSTSITRLPDSATALYNLQTLSLAFCFRLSELPKDFHRLANLRHLDVNSSGLKELPDSLSLLSNLQTLKLSRCRFLTKLPEEFHRLVGLRRLEVQGTALESMPTRLSDLKSLRNLSTFVVGEDIGSKIGELAGFSDLRGTLHIKNLQNVVESDDASEARLRDKKYLEGLQLEWGKRGGDSKNEEDVLDCLLPNTALRQVVINCYRGREFPDWLGNQGFRNMVDMSLLNCKHCLSLPPVGQLLSLKNLQISGLDSVVRVGSEFYGKSSTAKPFASLEVLEIKQMPKWKEWKTMISDSEAFPKLRKLLIQSCNSLTGHLPSFLPSLTDLTVSMCDRLVPSLPAMPNVDKLELKMCENLSKVVELRVLESFQHLRHLEISADSLSIRLKSLPDSVKTLKIQSYRTLEFQLEQVTNSLEELSVECSDEGSFVPRFSLDSFPNIRKLRIGGCQNLHSLLSSPSQSLQNLSTLEITNCPESTLFPKNTSPFPNLTSLSVVHCKSLQFLSDQLDILVPSLKSMAIKGSPEMETFSKSGLPSTLRSLSIENCDKIMSSRMDWNLQNLVHLTEFTIGESECDEMESFPEEGLLPSAITELNIWYLECLETLDSKGLQKLTSLKQLLIYDCPNLEAMTDAALPASLESLRLKGCPSLQEKCRKETGKYWDKISHIPWVYFDYKLVS